MGERGSLCGQITEVVDNGEEPADVIGEICGIGEAEESTGRNDSLGFLNNPARLRKPRKIVLGEG